MKRLSSLLFLLFAVLLPIRGYSQIQMPTPKEGDRWEFKAATKESSSSSTDRLNGNYEVAYINGKIEAYELGDGQKSVAGPRRTDQLRRLIAFAQDEEQYLKFPLSVGNKWTATYSVQAPGAKVTRRRSAEFTVEQESQTKTIAGTFQTLRIKGSNTQGASPQEWIYSYSPECKCIVKFYYDSAVGGTGGKLEIELTKFTAAQ